MEKRQIGLVLVACATLLGGTTVARGDEPPAPAAHHAHKKKRGAKPQKASVACNSDDDCAFTTFEDGACCPMLCQGRAVSKKSAEAIVKYAAECKKPEGGCPVAECAPPRITTTPACVSGKCVARAAPGPTRE